MVHPAIVFGLSLGFGGALLVLLAHTTDEALMEFFRPLLLVLVIVVMLSGCWLIRWSAY